MEKKKTIYYRVGWHQLARLASAGVLLLLGTVSVATANTLQDIAYSTLSDGRVQVTLKLSEPAGEPLVFTIDDPARIALDLPNTTNGLAQRSQDSGVGVVTGYSSAEVKGRTRVVVNLSGMTSYEAVTNGNIIHLNLGQVISNRVDDSISPVFRNVAAGGGDQAIQDVSFTRGEKGEGVVRIRLPSSKTNIDMRQEGADMLIVEFLETALPEALQRELDVTDFATPVYTIKTIQDAKNTRMEIRFNAENEYLSYQSNEDFIIEVKPLAVAKLEAEQDKKGSYTGERLSLNFQDIEVRALLQLLADFTGLNVVVSDTVAGNITLRLQNVPWDQALDIILRTKGLAQRQTGNVVLIAPAAEIANAERLELEAAQQVRELEPLTTEFIRISYADANDIASLVKAENNTLLSDRGSVTVDDRTNTLLVRDTATQILGVKNLINELDVPVRQVLIESRIVSADDNFSKDLGVRFGFSRRDLITNTNEPVRSVPPYYSFGGGQAGDTTYSIGDTATPTSFHTDDQENYIVDLPAVTQGASVKLAVGKIGTYLLQLELSAMQQERRGEVISNPRLITSANNAATIKQGVAIPYQEASEGGATATQFQEAVLKLDVTPQITPDERVIMDLTVSNDTETGRATSGAPIINKEELSTQVTVNDGETVVLGGVYKRNVSQTINRVPFFGNLPLVGWAFRNKQSQDNKNELLIFVTPKILRQETALN